MPTAATPEVVVPAILTQLTEWRRLLSESDGIPPELLWHYTQATAAINIIQSQELWATNVVFMNDQTEIAHAAQLLTEELDARGSGNPPIPAHVAAREVLGALHNFIEAYAVCFCADGDLLSQWRGYTGRGGRYALGFTSQSLSSPISRCDLARVEYDEKRQRQRIADLLDVWERAVQPFEIDEPPLRNLSRFLFAQSFALVALTSKNSGFAEEQEWRMFWVRPRPFMPLPDEAFNLEFRDRDGFIVPFVRVPVPDLCGRTGADDPAPTSPSAIVKVLVGPSSEPALAASGIWHLLCNLRLNEHVEVLRSSTPLRSS